MRILTMLKINKTIGTKTIMKNNSKICKINEIDYLMRDLEDNDNTYLVMKYILDKLDNDELKDIKREVKILIKLEKNTK